MSIIEIEKVNVVDEVFEQMRENIFSGEWSPDNKIPSENTLCKLFGVSRNTIRSAIQKLKALGVLTTRQGQGTFINNNINEDLIDSFFPVIYLDKNHIIEILEFRRTIEIESVRLASMRDSVEDIGRIGRALDKMIKNRRDYKKYSIADYQFHLSIAKASNNSIFYRVMLRLKVILYSHFEEMNKDLGPELSLENHKKVFYAIKNRNPRLAVSLLKEIIDVSLNKLKSE